MHCLIHSALNVDFKINTDMRGELGKLVLLIIVVELLILLYLQNFLHTDYFCRDDFSMHNGWYQCFWQVPMSNNVIMHLRCEDHMYCSVLKNDTYEVTVSIVEARICKKLAVDESNVKLKLGYIPLLVGFEEKVPICDDDDLYGYLFPIDKNNCMCILFVQVIKSTEFPKQLSRADKRSTLGMNYEVWQSNDDEIRDKAITLYGDNNQFDKQPEE